MIAIILGVLKWIGIVLLSLLLILLLLLLLVLFVPIRYCIRFQRTGLATDPAIEIKGKVSWLLSFVRALLRYPADQYLKVKVFLFTIFTIPKPEQKKKKQKKVAEAKDAKELAEEENFSDQEIAYGEEDSMEESNSSTGKTSEQGNHADIEKDSMKEVGSDRDTSFSEGNLLLEKNPAEEMKSVDEKESIRSKINKLSEAFRKMKEKFCNLMDKIEKGQVKAEEVRQKAEYYQKVFESKMFHDAFALCKKELLGILKCISPSKIDAHLEIGLEDPATTASILSYYGMLYPWIYDKVRVVGNFEEKIIRTNGIIKGKIRIATILFAGIRVYFNKNIRKLLRMMKKEEHQNGRK